MAVLRQAPALQGAGGQAGRSRWRRAGTPGRLRRSGGAVCRSAPASEVAPRCGGRSCGCVSTQLGRFAGEAGMNLASKPVRAVESSLLFSPYRLRDVTFPNRIVIAPMQMYKAGPDGKATDWHFQHLAKYAVGGAGMVMTEGLIIDPVGRNTYGDLG